MTTTMTSSIQITPTSPLDWPTSPSLLPRTTVLIGGPSYLGYTSHRRTSRGPLAQFAAASTGDGDTGSQSTADKIRKDKKPTASAAIDLTTLTPAALGELDYYQILGGIQMHSTAEQVKRAFHRASLRYHPDKQEEANGKKNQESGGNGGDSAKKKEETKEKEDPIFLKVKEAFETLGGDPTKRKAYDSTIRFDESVPSAADLGGRGGDFYTVFGGCFERNLRFAVENDPSNVVKSGSTGGGGAGGGSGRKKGKGNRNARTQRTPGTLPSLGTAASPIATVNEFYEYWIHFESWRDFTISAAKLTENDTENYEMCRFQKRAMEQEIARKAKSLKKEEMARISRLVERAMALDPRLRAEKERVEAEKADKIRAKREKAENIEREKREEEERRAKEAVDKEQEEKEERVRSKAKRDQEKKILRKSRQSLRKMVVDDADKKHDVDFLCERLSSVQIDDLAQKMAAGGTGVHGSLIKESVDSLREEDDKKVAEENRKREVRRQEAVRKEAAAKAARASKPWSKEELAALAKAVKKYPAGGANRWETISLFINNVCRLEDPRSKEQCIEKYNQVANSSTGTAGGGQQEAATATTPSSASKNPGNKKNAKEKITASSVAANNAWTDEQVKQLQKGLSKYSAKMEKNERWVQISKGVSGKTKKECVQRFKVIRTALKNGK